MNFPSSFDVKQTPWLAAPSLRAVLAALRAAGGEARVVGGAVRDALLGRAVGDVDLACNLPPDRTMAALEAAGIKAMPTGFDHGTVTAVVQGKGYEITSLRADVETDGRHAKVSFIDDWQADASRRDFTMNALYCDEEGRLYDPLGGLADLAAQRVRFIGNPADRLREDVLRLLRFFRFMAQLAQPGVPCVPDPAGLEACRAAKADLKTLSAERVGKEMLRLLAAPDPAPVWDLMAREGILPLLLPEALPAPLLEEMGKAEKSHATPDAVRRLGAAIDLSHYATAAKRLRLSNEQTHRLRDMGKIIIPDEADHATLRQVLYDFGRSAVEDVLLWREAQGRAVPSAFWPLIAQWEKPVFPVRGADLLARGEKPGAALGQKLRALEAWWRAQDFKPDQKACLVQLEKGA